MMVCELGVAAKEKSGVGGGFTTTVALVVCIKLPLVPVSVSE
jgi:hypothetical protein